MQTYRTAGLGEQDKAQLGELLEALNASPLALRRDTSGLWVLQGSRGYCATWGDNATWQLVVAPQLEISARQWTAHKNRLAFAELTQDGDTEGCFRLHRLPTDAEATIIRDIVGIRKRRDYSLEVLARLQEHGKALQRSREAA